MKSARVYKGASLLVLGTLVSAVLALVLSGCSGGFNCPFEKPSCCDNALFGCGTFDLPSGCSCSDYFSSAVNKIDSRTLKVARATVRARFSGAWRVALSRGQATCPATPASLQGSVGISQTGNRISLRVPGYGTVRGVARGNGFEADSNYSSLPLSCSAKLHVSVGLVSPNSASVAVQTTVTCPKAVQGCSASYSGKGQRV